MDRNKHAAQRPVFHNRIREVLAYVTWYTTKGQERLSTEAGVSASAVSRLVTGQSRPTFEVVWKITKAFERHLGHHIDPRELFSFDGTYPTKTVRELCGARLKYFTGRTCDPDSGLVEVRSSKSDDNGAKPPSQEGR